MVLWNPHVADYYNIVFVYSNTCGFQQINCNLVFTLLSVRGQSKKKEK